MSPAQRVLLDQATRGPVLPTPRQRPVMRALVARGWLERGFDMRFSLTALGRAAYAEALCVRQRNPRLVENWDHAREKRRANVGR